VVPRKVIKRKQSGQAGIDAECAPGAQYSTERGIDREASAEQAAIESRRTRREKHSGDTGDEVVDGENEQIQVGDGVPQLHRATLSVEERLMGQSPMAYFGLEGEW